MNTCMTLKRGRLPDLEREQALARKSQRIDRKSREETQSNLFMALFGHNN